MQLDRLPLLPSDPKVMPVTMVFTSSAASKEEGEYSDVSEPEIVKLAPQLETQVDGSANLISAVIVISTSPEEDTYKVEDVKMLSESDDGGEKIDTTTMDSTDKTNAPIITDGDCQAHETMVVEKLPEVELGLITTSLDSPLHLDNHILLSTYYLPCAPPDDVLKRRSVEVRNLYYWSKTNPSAVTYQHFVDRGKGTSCIDIPDVWPDLLELWTEGTPCNKFPDYKMLYYDDSYIKFHFGKPIVCGLLIV